MLDQHLLGRAVVAVRQDGVRVVVEPADVLPAVGAHRAQRLVGSVVGHLGEDQVVDPLDVAVDERHQRRTLKERRPRDARDLAERGVEVEVAHHRIDHPPAVEAARAAHDQHHPGSPVIEGGLRAGERQPVVRGADDQRPLREVGLVEAVQHRADPLVE